MGAPGNDDRPNLEARIRKRSVSVAGHRTSVSLEAAFWDALKRIARDDGCTVNELVRRVDSERGGNLSSALRVFVLARVRRHA
ncbi:MAG: ribbon-helix-helix domain-containing protein [Proteobacteria bacterium]|nr:ribbon-helix-helix domain-containing protein [Pseudomonadota bacterium]